MIEHFTALFLGFLLDLCLGDPHGFPHPVRLIGALISKTEAALRRMLPPVPGWERFGGALLVAAVCAASSAGAFAVVWAAGLFGAPVRLAAEAVLCYTMLAARSLRDESMKVYHELKRGDLPAARRAVSMIVGRDTDALGEQGVTKAAVETVAENASDGVVAPMLFLLVGGAPLGFFYKAVNTMDSMVGYKNDRYRYFGTAAAKLDDLLNLIPARIAGLLMIAAAFLCGLDGPGAARVFFRDRKNHASPNSAHTEAACAGALGVQLAGDAVYFGKTVQKPLIGDANRPVEAQDIPRANRLMILTAALCLLLSAAAAALWAALF